MVKRAYITPASLARVRDLLDALEPTGQMGRAIQIALIRSGKAGKALAAKEIGKLLYLKQSVAKSDIRVRNEFGGAAMKTMIKVSGQPRPISINKANSYTGARGLKRGGVTLRVRRDKGKEKFRHAHIGGGLAVLSGRVMRGPGVAPALIYSGAEASMRGMIMSRFVKNLAGQANRLLDRRQ